VSLAVHRGGRDGVGDVGADHLGSQLRAAPARQRHPGGGRQLAGRGFHLGALHRGKPWLASGAGQVVESIHSVDGEPAPPLADGAGFHAEADADCRVRRTPRGEAGTKEYDDGNGTVLVMADPEGNEFCIVEYR